MNNKPVFDYPLFAMGFRAFFALAGLSALAFIALWNNISHGGIHLANYYPAQLWHAHEMLLGYAAAVIAGFLLTAVRNWTNLQPVNPNQLAALCFIWLYGRITPFYAGLLPDVIIAAIDIVFLPLLGFYLAKPLLKTGNFQNLLFVLLLALMALANGLIHAQILGLTVDSSAMGLSLLVAIIVTMIVVMAGRVFPFFTERGLSGHICIKNPLLDMAASVASVAALAGMVLNFSGLLPAVAGIAALLLNGLRVAGWYDRRIWFVPLLWVLYLGYGWIILGFGLLSLAAYGLVLPAVALHAFTVGGIGVLTLGMMARVALGHTGRPLKASNMLALAFLLINVAALCRVMFPALIPAWHSGLLLAASYSWLAAFSLFLLYYTPILVTPRLDGKAG